MKDRNGDYLLFNLCYLFIKWFREIGKKIKQI